MNSSSALQPRFRFSQRFHLSRADVRTFAAMAEDANPIHYDRRFAGRTRFGGIIASGAHLSALLMGITATHYSSLGDMVGLEFSFRFYKPVMAGESIVVEWLVVRSEYKGSVDGWLVDLRGRIVRPDGSTSVGAAGKILVMKAL